MWCAGEAQDAWQRKLPSVPEVVRDSYRKAEERSIPNGLRSSVENDVKSRSAFAPPGRPPGATLNGMAGPGVHSPQASILCLLHFPSSHVDSSLALTRI